MPDDPVPEVEHFSCTEMSNESLDDPLEANFKRLHTEVQNMEEETRFGFLEHALEGSAQLQKRLGFRCSANHVEMNRVASVERPEKEVGLACIVRQVEHERRKTRYAREWQHTTRRHETWPI